MAATLDILAAQTNFFRLAKVAEIKYIVSRSSTDDHALLEAELQLRRENHKVLAILYPKELWTFSIDGSEPPVPSGELQLKKSATHSFNPQQMHKPLGSSGNVAPLLTTTLMKAVKKMLMVTLSLRNQLVMFGNCGLQLDEDQLIQIEPKILETGDLLVSLTQRPHHFQYLQDILGSTEVNNQYALYLIPSGIRCYLAGNTLDEALTTKPSNAAKITETLLVQHCISVDRDKCQWVKVIPNLQHLNGMTTQVANFLKPVTNTKSIAWPLSLCLVQHVRRIRQERQGYLQDFDPMSLIDDFVKLKATGSTKTPSTVPTSTNTPAEYGMISGDTPAPRQTPGQSAATLAVFEEHDTAHADTREEWDDLDEELFGGEEVTDMDFSFFDDNKRNPSEVDDRELEDALNDALMGEADTEADAQEVTDLPSGLELLTESAPGHNNGHQTGAFETADPYDIPIHEMTIPNTPPYTDPGAPLPVVSPRGQKKKSIFSPLTFNPVIKANVDDKYANGGKFHVSTVDTPAGDTTIPNLPLSEGFTVGHDEGDSDDSDSSDFEDESTTSEEDEEEEQVSSSASKENTTEVMSVPPRTAEPVLSGDLELKNQGFPTPTLLDGVTPDQSNPSSPSVASAAVPNPLPFLLRSIPVSTMPEQFYLDNPVINESSTLNEIVQQVVWDDSCLEDCIPDDVLLEDVTSEDFKRTIAQIFPDFQTVTLGQFSDSFKSRDAESPIASFRSDYNNDRPEENEYITRPPTTKDAYETRTRAFVIPEPKIRVKRLNQEISINATAADLWNTMGLESLRDPKRFRVVMLGQKNTQEQSHYFLDSFTQAYEKCHLGNIERIGIKGVIENGLVNPDLDVKVAFGQLNQQLIRGMDYKEIVILIPDYEQDLKSLVEKVRHFEEIKRLILSVPGRGTIPVNVMLKIIPSSLITNNGVFSVVSLNRLTRLALNIYNGLDKKGNTHTLLTSSLPKKIKFQLTQEPVADKILSEDSFIHLAYERSIDKNWFVASWTDDKSQFQEVKAWPMDTQDKNALETVMNKIWETTSELGKKLRGRKYLVLTRVNGGIADDELLQWKRLTSKTTSLTLAIVSVSTSPRLVLQVDEPGFPFSKLFTQDTGLDANETNGRFDSVPTVGSSTGLTPSIFTPQAVNSPDIFALNRSTTHDSPSDRPTDDSSVLQNIGDHVQGMLLDPPMSMTNSPGRVARIGLLVRPASSSNNRLDCFEVGIMSCPTTLTSHDLLQQLLIQYRALAKMGELYSVTGGQGSLIPWHVAAVLKVMRCLLHIRPEISS